MGVMSSMSSKEGQLYNGGEEVWKSSSLLDSSLCHFG